MGIEWRTVAVRDLVTEGKLLINDGYRVTNRELGPVGIPFVRGGDIGHDGGICTAVADHILPEFHDQVQTKLTRPGDVAFISKGTVGRVGFLREGQPPVVLSPQVCFWRAIDNDCIDSRFLYYLLKSDAFQANLDAVKTHGSMAADYVSLSDQRLFRLSLPSVVEQRAIARVLGSLDDKIELNRRMNETLEVMTRAVFRSWFMDFEPVRAKAEGRKPDGLDAATTRLFPDKFVDSTLGPVPKGWPVVPLPEVIEVNPRRSVPKGIVAPYLDMGNMPTTSARATIWEMREGGSGARFVNGDVLLARITPCLENGKTAFVDFLTDGQVGWGSTEYIVLRSKQPLPEEYAYFLARSPELRMFAIQNMTGTSGRQRVPAECFSNFCVVVPPDGLAKRFGDLAKVVMSKMKARDEESATLAEIRDGLLPKLLSGEISPQSATHTTKE